jgi:hypothetical protein
MLHIEEEAQDTVPMHQFPPVRYREVTPMRFEPPAYEKHIAECAHAHEDDVCRKGEGSGPFVVPLIVVSACLSAAALWHFVAWVWPW